MKNTSKEIKKELKEIISGLSKQHDELMTYQIAFDVPTEVRYEANKAVCSLDKTIKGLRDVMNNL